MICISFLEIKFATHRYGDKLLHTDLLDTHYHALQCFTIFWVTFTQESEKDTQT